MEQIKRSGQEILKEIQNTFCDIDLLTFTGYDNCILGFHEDSQRLVYSTQKILDQLSLECSGDKELIFEFFSFNFQGNNIKEKSPMIIYDLKDEWWY